LVFVPVVPVIVEVCHARHRLLVGAATVGVYLGDVVVVDGSKVCNVSCEFFSS
jgi:hypothetical protein